MAKGKRISEQPIVESLSGDELIPFAKNGGNGAVEADTIKEFAQDGLDDKYVAKEDGKGLSSNDYTDDDKSKVDGMDEAIADKIAENVVYIDEICTDFIASHDEEDGFHKSSHGLWVNYNFDADKGKALYEKAADASVNNKRLYMVDDQDANSYVECFVSNIGRNFIYIWIPSHNCGFYKVRVAKDGHTLVIKCDLEGQLNLLDDYVFLIDNDKVDKEDGKGLSTNDFTDEDKAKLDRFELVLADDYEIEDGLHQIASSEDYRSKLNENGYVVYHDVKYKVKDCGVTSDSYPWIVTEGAVITANAEGELNDHTQENVARSVYIWFDTILHYQPYNTSIPSKVSELQNDAKYQDEGHVSAQIKVAINAHEVMMEERLVTIESKVEDLNASKVNKVSGKQLSTEDFTTLLKQKLEGLTNYDDSTLTSELNALKSRLDTLVGSGDVTAVIDTFQEIEAFLQDVTNTQTLTGLLQEMKSEIVALCASTYAKLGSSNNLISSANEFTIIPKDFNNDIWINYGGSGGNGKVLEYRFADGSGTGTYAPVLASAYKVPNGTSSQFLKADGSVDSTAYLPTSGGDINGDLALKRKSSTSTAINYYFKNYSGTLIGALGAAYGADDTIDRIYIGWGNEPWSSLTNLTISNTVFNYKNNKVWHAGNDGTGSGLDADLLDGYEASQFIGAITYDNNSGNLVNLNIEANKDNMIVLHIIGNPHFTNIPPIDTVISFYNYNSQNNINNYNAINLGYNFGEIKIFNYNNSVCIWFKQSERFKSFVIKGYCTNRIYSPLKITVQNLELPTEGVTRLVTVIPKQAALITDNVASADKLTTKQLTNEDLNNIKDISFSVYYATTNTCLNKPAGVTDYFSLQVAPLAGSGFVQIINDSTGNSFKRLCNGGIWSAWKKMLTEDDIASLVSRIEALEARPTIASVDSLPSTPNNNTLYAIPE